MAINCHDQYSSFFGKFAISGSFCVVYVFAAELFPTEVRSIGIGFGSMVGRIGGVLAPFIILLQDVEGLSFLPYLIFGICGIISGIWALFLPDTARVENSLPRKFFYTLVKNDLKSNLEA